MRFRYGEYEGPPFPTQADFGSFDQFLDYLLEYGDQALEALKQIELDPEQAEILEQWIEQGLLEKVGVRFQLTPRAISTMQKRALMEVFKGLRPGGADGHDSTQQGRGGERIEGTRPFQFGDSVSEIDVNATMRNALARNALARSGAGLPIRVEERDFELHLSESKATCNTVILLDMSGSMMRWRRFTQAKKCAMAVYALIRQRFALDTVDVVGFYSGAEVIPEHKLPLAMPKRVTMYDPTVRMRVPVSSIASAPQHFTNLQMGLKMADQILARRGGENKQLFIITDGQPTAHLQGEYVYLLYPPAESTTLATLKEAMFLARRGIRFATFALVEDYGYMDWVGFVDQLAKVTKGISFYCSSDNLAECIMESYLSGKRKKAFLG